MQAMKVMENLNHLEPMAGDLVRVWKSNDPLYPSGVLGVFKGKINTKLKRYDILISPELPVQVTEDIIDVKKYRCEIINIDIDKFSIMKTEPTKKMLFVDTDKYRKRAKKTGILAEVKLFKINL